MLERVLLIHSDATARRRLRQQLETLEQVVVVAEGRDPADALAHAKARADIALVEVPDGVGDAQALDVAAVRVAAAGLAAFRHLGLDLRKIKAVASRAPPQRLSDRTVVHQRGGPPGPLLAANRDCPQPPAAQ